MYALRCTLPLLKRLGEPEEDSREAVPTTALGDWFVRPLNVGRNRLLLTRRLVRAAAQRGSEPPPPLHERAVAAPSHYSCEAPPESSCASRRRTRRGPWRAGRSWRADRLRTARHGRPSLRKNEQSYGARIDDGLHSDGGLADPRKSAAARSAYGCSSTR